MNERAKEINEFAPSSLSHIVGQRSVVAQVQTAIDCAFEDGRKMDSCLLLGAPGLGQESPSQELSQQKWRPTFTKCLGQSIASPSDLNAVLAASQRQIHRSYRRSTST